MRAVLLLCVCAYVVVGQNIIDFANLPKYDDRYDYLDVDALLNSKRLVRNYVDCLISAQRCTPEGKQLKRILPEALRTKCIRCTERQKKAAVKVIRRLKLEHPEEWEKVASRWDPTGDFARYFEEFLTKEHFNTIPGSAGNNDFARPSSIPVSVLTLPPAPPRLPVVPPTTPPPVPATAPTSTTARPVILNRFGDDGELMMGSPSSAAATPRPTTTTTRPPISLNTKPQPSAYFLRHLHRLLHDCVGRHRQGQSSRYSLRPTQMTWIGAGSDTFATRFPLRPTNEISPPYTTAITLIDQIGYKIIRTTELVTDILKNTVRAVVGR